MPKEINLDGTEIQLLKALGFGGGDVSGENLSARASDLAEAELLDALKGLIAMGYVVADKAQFQSWEEFKKVNFHINSGYSRDLKEAMDPQPERPKSKRVRRE